MKLGQANFWTVDALEIIYEGFETSATEETEWVRGLIGQASEPTNDEVLSKIQCALALHCPNLPDECVQDVQMVLCRRISYERSRRLRTERA
mgnify:CR=1 FL=1